MKLYRVKLVNGPADGAESLVSHDTAIWNDETAQHVYQRGPDDLYYYQPETPEKTE